MTPKEQYEARKKARNDERERLERGQQNYQEQQRIDALFMMEIADRFCTAAERIADALESPSTGKGSER